MSNRGKYKDSQEADAYEKKKQPSAIWDNRFTFGKYKGKLLSEIIRNDPQYITWAKENIPGFIKHVMREWKNDQVQNELSLFPDPPPTHNLRPSSDDDEPPW